MHAIRIHSYGGPEVVRFEDAPRPEPGPDQVLIRVHAAAVNPVDWKIRQGELAFLNLRFPATLGCEVAGVVERDCAKFKKGDEVYAFIALNREGGFAEYAVAFDNEAALKPKSLDFDEAASLPVAALTSWQALFDVGKLEKGQTVLIQGAAGGVAALGVQLAKWKGAQVIGTASTENLDFLRALGADEAIDYKTTRFEDVVKHVDLVFDTVGGDTLARSFGVVRKGGKLVTIAGRPSPEDARRAGIEAYGMAVETNGARLAEIAELADSGKLMTRVDRVFPLSQAVEALALSEKGQTRGKIVLSVTPPA
jgi:NADPH:quinone reductase-like Zn-dependent oxidoreductase